MYELVKLEGGIRHDKPGMDYIIRASKHGTVTGWRAGSYQQVLDYLKKNIIRMNINSSGTATWDTRSTRGRARGQQNIR